MKILAIVSQKGGVGKTNIATALAVAAQRSGKTTALLDLDPQATACFWADGRKANGGDGTPLVKYVNHVRLTSYLEALKAQGADLVILDCPPVHRDVGEAAITAADLVLIPTRADALDLRAMAQTVKLSKLLGKTPTIVLTFCPCTGGEASQAREFVIEELDVDMAPIDIHLRKAYPRAMQDGMTAQEYEPLGKAAQEIAALYTHTSTILSGIETHSKKRVQPSASVDEVSAAGKAAQAKPKDKANRRYAMAGDAETTLVGANLPIRCAKSIAYFHADTGLSKKEILHEALDLYFTTKGVPALRL